LAHCVASLSAGSREWKVEEMEKKGEWGEMGKIFYPPHPPHLPHLPKCPHSARESKGEDINKYNNGYKNF
jgi:hypothetical protein